MTRSPFGNKSQSTNSANKKSSSSFPIVQLIILGIGITLLAAVFVQNLQPTVQIILFGQKTLPISLSVAMLTALIGGGLLAFIFNAIADWRHQLAIRRAIVAANLPQNAPKEAAKSNNFVNNASANNPMTNSATNSVNASSQSEQDQDDWEEEYEDDEYEDDEFYDDEEEEEEEDNDPDTVPYGDRKNLKSAKQSSKSNREKRDRPPLEARYITPER